MPSSLTVERTLAIWPLMRLLALDVGDRTVGLAGCDELCLTTTGLYTLQRSRLESDLEHILETASERGVARIVVGLPISMNGTEGERASRTRSFARALGKKTSLPVVLWDERLSTFEAEGILRKSKVHWKKRKKVVDQVAAEVILRSYIDAGCPEPDRTEPAFDRTQEE